MERFEEKIIDLVDVIAESETKHPVEKKSTIELSPDRQPSTDINHSEHESMFQREVEKASIIALDQESNAPLKTVSNELEALVRSEVERLVRSTINENIQKLIREILTQEVEKAIAREIEILKKI
jgi:hypothetical protein